MIASLFSFLYELLAGENAEYPEYREEVFDSVGVFTVVSSLIVALVFYVWLGRWKMIWYNSSHWVISLTFCAMVSFGLSFLLTKNEIGLIDGYLIRFSLFNSLFAAVLFFLFSLVLKPFSIFSKHTPF